jgi:hypothetical protein
VLRVELGNKLCRRKCQLKQKNRWEKESEEGKNAMEIKKDRDSYSRGSETRQASGASKIVCL